MASHLLEVLRQGVWASLTGGWFHDPRQPLFINTVHLYLWIFLMALPLTLCLYFTSTQAVWTIYCGTVGMVFLAVKTVNCRFHYLFDTTEAIVEPEKETVDLDGNEEDGSNKAKGKGGSVGLNEPEAIELQDMSSSRTCERTNRGRTSSSAGMEDIMEPPTETNLKVDVHRNQSSSSSSSDTSSVSSRRKQNSSRSHSIGKDDSVDNSNSCVGIEGFETVVIHETGQRNNEQSIEDGSNIGGSIVELSMGASISPDAVSSKGLTYVLSFDSALLERCDSSEGKKLKETTSLELGGVLSHENEEESAKLKRLQFRRTRSVAETNAERQKMEGNCAPLGPIQMNFKLNNGSAGPTDASICGSQDQSAQSPNFAGNEGDSSSNSKPVFQIGSAEEIKESAEIEGNTGESQSTKVMSDPNQSDNSKSESESEDEQARCRTPLLARHASLEPKSSNDPQSNKREGGGGDRDGHHGGAPCKRVSFSTRSLDGSQHYYHVHHKGRSKQYDIAKDRDNRIGKEKRKRGGRSPKQAMYQRSESAVEVRNNLNNQEDRARSNVPVSASADNVEASAAELTQKRFALIPQNDSMVGWNLAGGPFSSQWMFQSVDVSVKPVSQSTSIDLNDEGGDAKIQNCDADSVTSGDSQKSQSFLGLTWLFASNNDLTKASTDADSNAPDDIESRIIPKELPIQEDVRVGAIPKRHSGMGSSSGRRNSRRGDRETSPRILERLLEESHEASPSSSTIPPDEPASHGCGSGRRKSHRHRRRHADRDSPVPPGAPFLHSAAREFKLQLRSLGPQNRLDVGAGFPSSSSQGYMAGVFRPRGDTEPVTHGDPELPNSSSAVNRHRRLMRLNNSRRSLGRRRDAPFSSPIFGGVNFCGTHVASSHDDTTEGAIHYFQDERGNWHSYTFSDKIGNSTSQILPVLQPTLHDFSSPLGDHYRADLEPRQATAGGSGAHPPLPFKGVEKTPSSSESWSSGSSTEFVIDSSTNKIYASYRRSNPSAGTAGHIDSGCPSPIASIPSLVTITPDYNNVSGSASSHALSTRLPVPGYTSMQRPWQRNRRDVLQVLTDSIIERRRVGGTYNMGQDNHNYHSSALGALGSSGSDRHQSRGGGFDRSKKPEKKSPRQYYNMKLLYFVPNAIFKVWFDRLKLMALFDRNRSFLETLLCVLLAIGVASLGSFMLHQEYYKDLTVVLLCFVMASCQFSLLKSVQPDAASPTHGFNRIVAFSRPIYFCLCGGLVYLMQTCLDGEFHDGGWDIYGVDITQRVFLVGIRDFLLIVVLCFPILFSIGLFPQINTFFMYLLEQVDMHGFGGNALSGLSSGFISLFRSFVAVGLLYGFAYGAMSERRSTQHLMFSIFCSLLVVVSYHMSRCTSDTSVMWSVLKQLFCPEEDCFGEPHVTVKGTEGEGGVEEPQGDPLPRKLRDTVTARLKSDAIICTVIGLLVFGLHSSTVFSALQPGLTPTLWIVSIVIGFFLHYLVPQFRKQLPCLVMSHPVLPPAEYHQFEVRDAARLMWFERVYVWLCFFERNILFPLLFISGLTEYSQTIVEEERFGLAFGSFVIVVTGLKALRTSFSDPGKHYLILFFTLLFFKFDWDGLSETFLVDFFFMSIAFQKVHELWLKLQFVITYIAPWQITWGSAFHAFAQPFSVPHSAMLFLQAVVSSFLSAPLNPFLGSAIFITSYVRPIKFWEKDYNTKRVDHSNTRLSTHLEKNPGADDNNLNSIFYEHLTRSLQDCLCGDLILGRWGQVSQGDCFVLASDYLNCLVHIIEVGNGLVTFQVRGLEFRGTYCQQREVEAISEGVEDDDGFCCCEPGHPPHMLSVNSAFSQRWLAWEVTVSKYVLEGYSISDNSAVSMLQVYDLRKILITYYVKSIIYYAVKSDKLEEWLNLDTIVAALQPTLDKNYAELDPVFSPNIDEDYDYNVAGVTRQSFCHLYLSWLQYCVSRRDKPESVECTKDSQLVSLCFALSILGRRALGVAAHSNALSSVEFFLYGLHALFKGDFRITCQRDEWVFCDMDLLRKVVSAAVRMSLKLHQDHFMCPDEYDDHNVLYDAITYHDQHLVISHEGDPAWRSAVLSGTPNLLALRHVLDDGTDEYKIIMLNKRHLSFRVIKLNRECVRGLWAGQQQELVYLRNRDPERGSIQNAKQALRNIINSSCDQPIGYPIYVSPLTTSYADTHPQVCSLIGGPISLSKLKENVIALWRRIRQRVGEGCSSGSAVPHEDTSYGHEGIYSMAPSNIPAGVSTGLNLSGSQSLESSQMCGSSGGRSSLNRGNFNRGSAASNVSKPSTSTLASLAGFLTDTNGNNRDKEKEKERGGEGKESRDASRELSKEKENKSTSLQRVRIVDANLVYDGLNLGRRIDVVWPDDNMRFKGGRSYWQNWVPEDGMEGVIVHKWVPSHRDPQHRSITDKTILLLKIEDKYVPIQEAGVVDLGHEV